MNKAIIVSVSCVLVFLIWLLFYRSSKGMPGTIDPPGIATGAPTKSPVPAGKAPVPQSGSQTSAVDVVLEPRDSIKEPDEMASVPRPEYAWYTQPTSKGTVKNSQGETIFQATDELPFISMRSRANVSKIVIIAGYRNAFVIDPETKQRVVLPKQPPEEGAKGFETWEWINNDTLIAEYHVQAKGSDGNSGSCCQGHGVAETRLYSYDLKYNTLVRVALPKQLEGAAFSIGRTAGDGSFEVARLSNHLTDEKSLGWFNVRSKK